MYKDPIRPLIKEINDIYSEARMLGDAEGMISACMDMYSVAFLQIKQTEGQLKVVSHLIKKYYEKEENSRGVRIMKHFGKKLYLMLMEQRQNLSEFDGLTNKLLGLEQ